MLLQTGLLASLAFPLTSLALGTRVIKTNRGPTGYEVTFVFRPNATESYDSVLLGGFARYSDPLGATLSYTDAILPKNWKPDCFSVNLMADDNLATYSGFNMTFDESSGNWTVTLPFPSGTFNYAFYPNCDKPWGPTANCKQVTDPSNPAFERLPGDQTVSNIQVPFDAQFQVNNYDWLLPLPQASARGNISYTTFPANANGSIQAGIGIYLPKEYGTIKGKRYPTFYLSHGGGGTDSDWFNQGRVQNMLDRLIFEGLLEPTVVVTPNFYQLGFTSQQYASNTTAQNTELKTFDVVGQTAFNNAVRAVYIAHLLPWVEANYDVIPKPASRAFSGLSLGGGLADAMLFNATDYFDSYCIMSNVPAPLPGAAEYNNTRLTQVGIFTGAGLYDALLIPTQNLQIRLGAVGAFGLSHIPQNGAHQWSTWQEIIYYYLKYGLWQPTPLRIKPAQGPFDLSGGVPY